MITNSIQTIDLYINYNYEIVNNQCCGSGSGFGEPVIKWPPADGSLKFIKGYLWKKFIINNTHIVIYFTYLKNINVNKNVQVGSGSGRVHNSGLQICGSGSEINIYVIQNTVNNDTGPLLGMAFVSFFVYLHFVGETVSPGVIL